MRRCLKLEAKCRRAKPTYLKPLHQNYEVYEKAVCIVLKPMDSRLSQMHPVGVLVGSVLARPLPKGTVPFYPSFLSRLGTRLCPLWSGLKAQCALGHPLHIDYFFCTQPLESHGFTRLLTSMNLIMCPS